MILPSYVFNVIYTSVYQKNRQIYTGIISEKPWNAYNSFEFFYRGEEEQKYEVCIRDFQNSLLFRRLRYNEIKRLGRYAGFSVPFGFCGYII